MGYKLNELMEVNLEKIGKDGLYDIGDGLYSRGDGPSTGKTVPRSAGEAVGKDSDETVKKDRKGLGTGGNNPGTISIHCPVLYGYDRNDPGRKRNPIPALGSQKGRAGTAGEADGMLCVGKHANGFVRRRNLEALYDDTAGRIGLPVFEERTGVAPHLSSEKGLLDELDMRPRFAHTGKTMRDCPSASRSCAGRRSSNGKLLSSDRNPKISMGYRSIQGSILPQSLFP